MSRDGAWQAHAKVIAELADLSHKIIPIELEHPAYRRGIARMVPGIDLRHRRALQGRARIALAFGEVLFEDMLRRRDDKEKQTDV